MKTRIGITVHVAGQLAEEGSYALHYRLNVRYAEAVVEAGGTPFLLPTHPDSTMPANEVLNALDGLLLSGGGRLPAQYFTDNPNPSLRDTNPARYDTEVALVRAALARGMPLLGICRGHQTIVEAAGGKLVRDLGRVPGSASHYQALPPGEPTHSLHVAPGSHLYSWVGASTHVNSFHRQAVSNVPAGWSITAWADNGCAEAVEANEGFAVGVQFHPEWLGAVHPGFKLIFADFIESATAYAGKRCSSLEIDPS